MQPTFDCDCPRLRMFRRGRGEWGTAADYLSVDWNGEGGLRCSADMKKMTARRVGAGGAAGDEGWNVSGGEGEYGSQITSLGEADLHESETLLCWRGR